MPQLLIVHHSPTELLADVASQVVSAAQSAANELADEGLTSEDDPLRIVVRRALAESAGPADATGLGDITDSADTAGSANIPNPVVTSGPIEATGPEGVAVCVETNRAATLADLHAADGIILGTPANFGYISGALKHFFDSTFTDRGDKSEGLPFSYWIRGGHDTTGADNAMTAITKGFGWSLAAEPVTWVGALEDKHRAALTEMAQTMAAFVATISHK